MTVRMTHPALPGRVIEVPDDAVPGHARSGWEPAPDPEPEPDPEPGTPGEEPLPGAPEPPAEPALPGAPQPPTIPAAASRRARTEEQ